MINALSFLGGTILDRVINKYLDKREEKSEAKRILGKISEFNRSFDNSDIDTYVFQQFLTQEAYVEKVFCFLFGNSETSETRNQIIDSISIEAARYVKDNSKKYNSSLELNDSIFEEYFTELFLHLERERVELFSLEQRALTAKLNSSINQKIKELKEEIRNEKFQISDKFIINYTVSSIRSLGERYTPEANVDLDITFPFDTLLNTDLFNKRLSNLIEKLNDLIAFRLDDVLDKDNTFIETKHNEIIELFESLKNQLVNYSSMQDIDSSKNLLGQKIKCLFDKCNPSQKTLLEDYSEKTRRLVSNIEDFVHTGRWQLIKYPYLMLTGDGGVGKSHLMADVSKTMLKENHDILLFLGQHYSSNLDPWQQMIQGMGIDCTTQHFLSQLNERAQKKDRRACIMIDALNEGEGRRLWKNYIQKFVDSIKEYPNITLAFSVRTQYIEEVIPTGFVKNNIISEITHTGFDGTEIDAIDAYCEYYKLDKSIFPYMHNEFKNPLFLKITAQYLNRKSIKRFEHDSLNLEEILLAYTNNINTKISSPERLNFDKEINVVEIAISSLMEVIAHSEYGYIEYMTAFKKLSKSLNNYINNSTKILDELVKESLLTKSNMYSDKKVVYFNFEKLHDYFMANYLNEYHIRCLNRKEDIYVIKPLYNYFSERSKISMYAGVIECLSIIVAEKDGKEIFELAEKYKEDLDMIYSVVNGLSWRSADSITDVTVDYVRNEVSKYKETLNLFFDSQLQFACNEKHQLNAQWFHEFLKEKEMGPRDYIYASTVNKDFSGSISGFLEWCNINVSVKFTNKGALLAVLQLSWLFSLSNRTIRDKATKSVINILINFPEILVEYHSVFKKVNDPYVMERVYACIYGAILKVDLQIYGNEVALAIYESVFNEKDVTPHILLRDYAKLSIEYILSKIDIPIIAEVKTTPPYTNEWEIETVTNTDIDELFEEYKNTNNQAYSAFRKIVNSMTTEYGRGAGAYGDFGRYRFGTTIRAWSNQFDEQELSNYCVKRILEMGYAPELHGEFDNNLQDWGRHEHRVERIGKKYQWIAFHELLAHLTDHYPTYEEKLVYSEEYQEYINIKQKNPLYLIRDFSDEYSDDECFTQEEKKILEKEMNEEDHIENIIKIPHSKYQGTWEPFVRDIDPTLLIKESSEVNRHLHNFKLPAIPDENWVQSEVLFEESERFLEVVYNSMEYIYLYISANEIEENNEKQYNKRNRYTFLAHANFVKKNNVTDSLELKKGIYGRGVSVPETYQFFLYELLKNQSYKEYRKNINSDDDNEKLTVPSTHHYMWESEYDFSKDESSISIYLPSEDLIRYFDLYQYKEGHWINKQDELIAVDSQSINYDTGLLFRKKEFIKFLEENDYNILWDAYGEKVAMSQWHERWYTVHYDEGEYKNYISQTRIDKYEN